MPYKYAYDYRKFDGKEFRLFGKYERQREAQADAKKLRKIGMPARVVKVLGFGFHYAVYKRLER